MSKIVNFLNKDAGVYTSARDKGDGTPITDVSDSDVKKELELIKAELQELKEIIASRDGDGTTNVILDQRGLSADKPQANTVKVGTTYWSVDTDPHGEAIEVSDGTKWVVV